MASTPWDLRNEEQVKQYLEKLDTEFGFQCFHEKQPDGCHRYADFQELTKKDHGRASAIFKQNCDENKYGHSCHKFANSKMLGQGTPKDSRVALSYYEQGCKYGYMQSCSNAGLMHLMGKGALRADSRMALELLRRACAGGIRESCYRLSAIYISGWPLPASSDGSSKDGKPSAPVGTEEPTPSPPAVEEAAHARVTKDMEQALAYSLKACEMGVYQACHNLSRMYRVGDGVPCDAEAADKYKKRAQSIYQELTEQARTITFGS